MLICCKTSNLSLILMLCDITTTKKLGETLNEQNYLHGIDSALSTTRVDADLDEIQSISDSSHYHVVQASNKDFISQGCSKKLLCPIHYDNKLGSEDCDICDLITKEMVVENSFENLARIRQGCDNEPQKSVCNDCFTSMLEENGINKNVPPQENLGINIHDKPILISILNPDNKQTEKKPVAKSKIKLQLDKIKIIKNRKKRVNSNKIKRRIMPFLQGKTYTKLESTIIKKLVKDLGESRVKKLIEFITFNCKSMPMTSKEDNKQLYLSLINVINNGNPFKPQETLNINGSLLAFRFKKFERVPGIFYLLQKKDYKVNKELILPNIEHYDNNTKTYHLFSTHPNIEYEKIINNLFFVQFPDNTKNVILNQKLWNLLLFIPEILYYLEWRQNVLKTEVIIDTNNRLLLEKELTKIYELIKNYKECNLSYPLKHTNPLVQSIADLRSHICEYLNEYHKQSIQCYMYNLAMKQETSRQKYVSLSFILFTLAFQLETNYMTNKYLHAVKAHLEKHSCDYYCAFKKSFFRGIERISYVFLILENSIAYMESKKLKRNIEATTITLTHPFKNQFTMLKIHRDTGGFINLKYADINDAIPYYYKKLVLAIIDQ